MKSCFGGLDPSYSIAGTFSWRNHQKARAALHGLERPLNKQKITGNLRLRLLVYGKVVANNMVDLGKAPITLITLLQLP